MRVRFFAEFLSDGLATAMQTVEQYEVAQALIGDGTLHHDLVRLSEQCRRHLDVLDHLARRRGIEPSLPWSHPLAGNEGPVSDYARWQCLERLLDSESRLLRQLETLQAIGEAVPDPALTDAVQKLKPACEGRVRFLAEQVRQRAMAVIAPG